MFRVTSLSTYVNKNHMCTLPKYTFSDQPFPCLLTYCHGSHFLTINNYITHRQGHILFLFTAQLNWKERKGTTVGMLRMFLYTGCQWLFLVTLASIVSVPYKTCKVFSNGCLHFTFFNVKKYEALTFFWTNQLTIELMNSTITPAIFSFLWYS